MKRLILFVFALPAATLCAQNAADSLAGPKADGHMFIPGTHVSMIVPHGFKIAKDFTGIEKDDKTYIEVFDPYENDYNTTSSTFTRPIFENKGMDVFTFKNLSVGHYPARYVGMKNTAGYRKYELLFGDTAFSALLLGHCPVNNPAITKDVENAILSVVYNRDKKIDPYVHTYFTLNDSASELKFSKLSNSVYSYSPGGKLKTGDEDALFTATPFPMNEPLTDKAIRKLMEGIYKDDGMKSIKVKNVQDSKINGYDAHEAEIYGKVDGKETMIYQLVISKDKQALLIMGITKKDFDKNLADFKKLAYTINFKEKTGK